MCISTPCRRHGFALPLTLFMGTVLFLVAGALLHTVLASSRAMAAGADAEAAFWLARSALVRAEVELARNPDWASSAAVEQAVPFQDGTGSYAVRISRRVVNFNDFWIVSATGTRNLATRRLVATLRRDTFSRYSYFSHFETTDNGTPIWFNKGDEILGPVFSNDQYHMYGDPHFVGKVNSAKSTYKHAVNGAVEEVGTGQVPVLSPAPRLDSGFEGNHPPELTIAAEGTRDAAMVRLKELASAGGLVLTGPHYVMLTGTTVSYVPVDSSSIPTGVPTVVSLDSLTNRVVFVEGQSYVEGSLDGRLTLASQGDMVLVGPVAYRFRQDPTAPQDDMLGLVSRGHVKIRDSNPHDLQVDASILALGESFYFQGNGFGGNPAVQKGRLTVFGGLAQVRRGAIGKFGPDGTREAGYEKDYRYDPRLTTQAPPWFPSLVGPRGKRIIQVSVRDLDSLGAAP